MATTKVCKIEIAELKNAIKTWEPKSSIYVTGAAKKRAAILT